MSKKAVVVLKAEIAICKAKLHSHEYKRKLALHSSSDLIHTLFKIGRKDVPGMALEFLSEYPEYMGKFIAHYNTHKTLMPLPEDPSKDPENPLRLEYESLMKELGSLIDNLYEIEN